jgi:PAS domain S-box-containing protein
MQGSSPADAIRVLDVAADALIVLSPEGLVREWNRAAEQLFGRARADALGRAFAPLVGARAPWPQLSTEPLDADGCWRGEIECAAADGRAVFVDCTCRIRRDEQGAVCAVDCSMVDVSERRRAEKEIILLHNVMAERLRKRNAELEESTEGLRDFAYSIAHDLRAPLASIDGFSAQLAARLGSSLDDTSRHYLRRVRAGVKLMSRLTDGLLELADVTHVELLPQQVDLSAVARRVLDELRESDPGRAVTVAVHATPPVRGDLRLLTDALARLLDNAWKFTSQAAGARIEFGSAPDEGGPTRYFVRDNGAGFDAAYAHKLFGPFQRLHKADEFDGTGIGLAIVRKVITRHGGRVWAEGAPGEGATVSFTLP